MDFVDIIPLVFTIAATLIYKLIGKPEKKETPSALMKTLDIIEDSNILHEDLVNIYKELQEIRKILNGR